MSIQRFIGEVPSEEFYSILHYTKILKLLGYEGPSRPGALVRCPKCKTANMLVSELCPFGAWLSCDKCKLSGECLKLYGTAYNISNPESIIDRLLEELKIKDVKPEDRILYCKFYEKRYNRIGKAWELSRASMFPVCDKYAVGRLNELNLWTSQDVFNRSLISWFGFAYKHDLEELLDDKIPGCGKGVEGLLVIPFYLRPGFIAGFGFIGYRDQMSYLNLLDGHAGGICGLGACHKSKATSTYVMPHPLQAARIVHKCALEGYAKLSVVAKAPIGELDPLLLRGDVVLWTGDTDTAFLKTCVKTRGFKVMLEDPPYIWRPAEKSSKLWESSFMPTIHNRIDENKLLDPLDFLVTELLTMGLVIGRAAVEAMELTEFQKNLILASCSDDIRQGIGDILSHRVSSQPVLIDKKMIFERNGCLWIQGSREIGDELACSAITRITHICRVKQTGEAVLFGKLLFNGAEVSFNISEQELERDPAKMLSYLASTAGIDKQPVIAPSIVKKYLDIIIRLSSPEVHSVQNYIGFDQDTGRFNLPNISIDVDQIRVGMPFVVGGKDIPGANVVIESGLTVSSIANILEYDPEAVTYLAAMAGMISCIHNNYNDNSRTNLMLVGSKGSMAEYIFDVLRLDLCLGSELLQTKAQLTEVAIKAMEHQLPVAINGLKSKPKLLAQWLEGQGQNSIVLADSFTASAMGADKDWYFVRADLPFTEETRALLNSENVFPFFMQYSMTVPPTNAKALLDTLKYLCRSLSKNPVVMDGAKARISDKGYLNAKSPGIHLMNFILEGVESGMFKTFTGGVTKKRYVVLKNPMEDTVTVDLANLLGQMRYFGLPVVVWESSVAHLKSIGVAEVLVDGVPLLVFPKPIWNSLVAVIRRLKSKRKAAWVNLFNSC